MVSKLRQFYEMLVFTSLLCIGMYYVLFSVMGTGLESIPGYQDSLLNNYFLEHGFKWLSGQQASFWNAPFFYPTPNVMAFSDNMLGNLPIYSIFRFLGFDRETSFQWWLVTIFILNYLACALVLKKFSINSVGAAAGAFVFTFSLPVIAHMDHVQVLPRFMIPPAFYFVWQYLKKPRLSSLAGLCLCIVWQMYCTIYMGFFLVLGLAAFVMSYLIFTPKPPILEIVWGSRSKFFCRAPIIIAAVLCLFPLAIPYHKAAMNLGYWPWGQISSMLPVLRSYVFPARGSLLWNWLTPVGKNLWFGQSPIFAGALPWAAVVIALVSILQRKRETVPEIGRIAAFSILLVILLTSNVHGFSFYRLLTVLPGARAIRGISRIILMLCFLFAAATGAVFTKLESRENKGNHAGLRFIAVVVLLCLLVLDQHANPHTVLAYSKSEVQRAAQDIADAALRINPRARILAYMPPESYDQTGPGGPAILHLVAMMAAQSIDIATVNGYSATVPYNYFFSLNYNQDWALCQWMAFSKAKYEQEHASAPSESVEHLFDDLVVIGPTRNVACDHPASVASHALPDNGFNAEIVPASRAIRLKPNATIKLPVRVTNRSDVIWPSLANYDGQNKIALTYRWLMPNQRRATEYFFSFPLHYDLLPGEAVTLDAEIKALKEPGNYIIEFDMIQETVATFGSKGSNTALIAAVVSP